jgi:hypothetical protein
MPTSAEFAYKKIIAALAPFALALPIPLAGPAAASSVHRAPRAFLRCTLDARSVRGGLIAIHVRVDGSARGRQDLSLKLDDYGHTVARESVFDRLPFNDFRLINNRRGPDFLTFTAVERTTFQRCSDWTIVRSGR